MVSSSSMGNENENFTLKFWFEGNFKSTEAGLEYLNGQFHNLPIDPDLTSWFDLEDLVASKLGVAYVHTLFYMVPDCFTFDDGLKRVNDDDSVMQMAAIGVKYRAVDVYIVKEEDDKKLQCELINGKLRDGNNVGSDGGSVGGDSGSEDENELLAMWEGDNDSVGRDSVLVSYIVSEDEDVVREDGAINDTHLSEYEDSEDDVQNHLTVTDQIDFRNFEWVVGTTFPNRNSFKML